MSSKEKKSIWSDPAVRQTWVVLPILLHKMGMGMTLGFTTCLLAGLQEPDSTITMDLTTSSWYASSMGLSWMVGHVMATYLMYKHGRRMAFLINCIPSFFGLFFTVLANDVTSLMIGRVLTGITVGNNAMMAGIVIGEYCSPSNRGMFLNMKTAILNVGSLIVHVMGHFTSWRTLAVIVELPFIISFLMAWTWPESPAWLAERKQTQQSEKSFYWLRGKTADTTREIKDLIKAQEHKKKDKTIIEDVVCFFAKFKKQNFLKPVAIIVLGCVLLEVSGRHIFPSYAGQLIAEVSTNTLTSFHYNIILDVLIAMSGFLASYLIRIMKMRTLLFSTGTATFLALALASLSLYLVTTAVIPPDYFYIPLFLFAVFFILTNLGCTCVPVALIGEVFPLEHRAIGCALAGYVISASMTVSLNVMPLMVHSLNIYGAFGILAGCMGAVLLVLYFILPETTNKTLQEIEDYFTYGTFREGVVVPGDDEGVAVKLHDESNC